MDAVFRRQLVLVFLAVLIVYLASPVTTQTDSKWVMPVAKSLITEGNTNLDEYGEVFLKKFKDIEYIRGHYYSIFPVGTSILIAPLFMLPEKVLSALITALAVVFFSLTVYALTKSQSVTIVSSLLLAFGTSAWSTASLALWQHGPSMLMLSIALYLLVQVRHKPQVVPYIAIPLAFSFIIRPTNSISILFFSVHIFLEYRNYFLRYCLWGASIGLLFFVFNYSIYESFLPAYYLPSRLVSQSHFLEALLGNLISPGRGLFIFSPFLILAIYGLYLKYRNKNINILDIILASIIVFHWLVISSFPHWWAGHSIGPRFWTDILLYVLFFIIPVISKNIYNPLLVSLAVISIIWHFHSVSDPVVFDWNSVPNNIDMFPARVWDWRDAPLLRGSRWSLMIY